MKKTLAIALVVTTSLSSAAFAEDTISEFRIGILGGENAQDRMTSHECLKNYAEEALGVPVKVFAPADYAGVIEGLLGPDILIYSAEFFIKNARTDHFVSMHQDLTYWGMGTTSEMVTAWIALSPATPESGCMDFVRGSHKSAILPHKDTFDDKNLLSRGQEVQADVRPEDKTPIILQPGQMSLHHGLTIHGSGPNTSDDRRIAAVVRYITPRVSQNVADKDYAMVVRGADRVGNFIHYAPPSALFTPQSVALYTEIRAARAKAMMAGTSVKKGIYA